jgi:hypothetical protein
MQSMRWLSLLTAATIITACFFTWVSVEEKHFYIGGFFSSTGNRFGEPGLFHVILCTIYILLVLINKVWSLRTAFFISAFNIAWAVRNFMLISACSGGTCPEKHTGLYAILIGSILLIILTALVRPSKTRSLVKQ